MTPNTHLFKALILNRITISLGQTQKAELSITGKINRKEWGLNARNMRCFSQR